MSNRGDVTYWIGKFSEVSLTDKKHYVPNFDLSTQHEDYESGVICVVDEEGRPCDFNKPYTAGDIKDLARILIKEGHFWGDNDSINSHGLRTATFMFQNVEGTKVPKRFVLGDVEFEDALKFQNYLVQGDVSLDERIN